MQYIIQPGDTLSGIALAFYGNAGRWTDLATVNDLKNPNFIFVGQQIHLPQSGLIAPGTQSARPLPPAGTRQSGAREPATASSLIPAQYYMFVVADEINPFTRKLVRRVVTSTRMAEAAARTGGYPLSVFPNPEKFGFLPTDAKSPVTVGRHVQGLKPSSFTSASTRTFGATRFAGKPFWIDVPKAQAAGATIHETAEIARDLDRIISKTRNLDGITKLQNVKRLMQADKEVLVKGAIPAAAVKGTRAMALTRGLQGVQVVGFAMSAYDLKVASQKSFQQQSAKPVAAEAVRQVGGWAAAWAGMKLGAAGGALVGIETGPGAVVTAGIGGIIGGAAGYFGADWVADHIDEN